MVVGCPWCGKDMELHKEASKIAARPLSERVYCYSCDGVTGRKPHPPLILVYEVIQAYADGLSVQSCRVTIFQYGDVNLGAFKSYTQYIKRRNPKQLVSSDGGPRRKDRHNPFTGIFKCIFCRQKPGGVRYDIMERMKINDGRLVYVCPHHPEDRNVTFILEKRFFARKAEPKDLPLPAELFKNEQLSWESWVLAYFEMKLKALPVAR